MRRFRFLIFPLILFSVLLISSPDLSAQSKFKTRKAEKSLSGSKRKAPKETKVRQPRAVSKAKKTQEKNEDRLKKDYKKAVKANKARHYNIQSRDVKERMEQNEQDIKARDKEKRKKARKDARKKGSAKKKFKKR
ncbi:MAG: hypothetical protein QNK33_08010 [Bacteroidales bacterium]|nr:hypothetical protein [Bacteroidales bacterium]